MVSIPNLPKISLTRNQIIMISIALGLIVIIFLLFQFLGSKKPPGVPVTLTVWGIDTPEAFESISDGYVALRPNVTLNYVQIAGSDYDATVLRALATGNGPDVFVVGNHDLFSRGELLSPALPEQIPLSYVQENFPQAVLQDFVLDGNVYALPLYMDTLALVYNKAMFDQAGVAVPPGTWQDVLDVIPRLRVLDPNGQISRAAIAIGGTERSVAHAVDILNLLMLQNGVAMNNSEHKPSFAQNGAVSGAAFRFYLQFADTASPAYTWNDLMGTSLESFTSQKAAMILAYKSNLAEIQRISPFLQYGVVAMPQISLDSAVNYPKYHGLGVWVGSTAKEWAWDFVAFASINPAAQEGYLQATGRPPALRALIDKQQRDPNLSVFARASLTARSWKMGDYDKIKSIFNNAIQNVQAGAKSETQALKEAEDQAGQLVIR